MASNRTMSSKRWLVGFASAGAAALLAACGTATDTAVETTEPGQDQVAVEEDYGTEDPMAGMGDGNTVIDVAASEEDFSILVEAIEAAGLTETLVASGPLTVFAPTNAAFEALPEGTLDELLLPENQDVLQQVLVYHVLQEEVTSDQIATGEVQTAVGTPLNVIVDETTGEVMVNNAQVIEADIQASNGVIHAVDQVILPPGVAL
ncbi:fasciclin domain-containing protein [Nodosilinea sp. P-1105]|uniref:fasciclin domain-containing protein n=1 Tax=Nodosilinea sp. P-1105 TaxID=2546229 RepID=UPI001F0D1F0D|nr:fasciclin domain-containing protein [Nodosilinea sp. P-1105]